MPALDLRLSMASFLAGPRSAFQEDDRKDLAMLAVLSDRALPSEVRVASMAEWLRAYGVHRIPGVTASGLASIVIAYADDRSLGRDVGMTIPELLNEFDQLRSKFKLYLHTVAPAAERRAIESLTSKALWCCYPSSTPILDHYAENAVRMLCRLQGQKLTSNGQRYADFVDAWFNLYALVESSIPSDALSFFPYKVRLFDHMLWWLGQDNYS